LTNAQVRSRPIHQLGSLRSATLTSRASPWCAIVRAALISPARTRPNERSQGAGWG
jgi:hypothetical protein